MNTWVSTRESSKRWLWIRLVVYLLGAFLLAAWVLPGLMSSRARANESLVAGRLRTINAGARVYADTYGSGFPASLAVMGPAQGSPSCRAAGLVDEQVAAGEFKGYRFEYRPGEAVEKAAENCPAGVKTYTILARPVEHGRRAQRSFFSDQSGVIRWTREDRAATAQDPPLE